MQDRPVFGNVDLFALEHRVDPRAQVALLRELQQQLDGLVGNTVLRVIQIQPHALGGQSLAALGVIREKFPQMHVFDALVMRFERLPRGTLCQGRFIRGHIDCGRLSGCSIRRFTITPPPRFSQLPFLTPCTRPAITLFSRRSPESP